MSDIRYFRLPWKEWELESKIGEGSFGTVWKVKKSVLGGKVFYAAVKHISIPKDENEIDRLIGEGVFSDEQSANHYYDHMLQSIIDEIDAMHKLQGYTNIVAYEDDAIIPKGNGVGYDLFLRMELLQPLTERIRQGMRTQDVIALGKDIATAIGVLRDHNMIHRDIKPQNIFINDRDIYKLGDYGTARALGTDATAMSRKGTYNYMSPEIYNNQKADIRADIYSLGLVLYRLLNANRLPFLPVNERITSEDSDIAVMRRISGEKIEPPKYADNELSAIVLKACAFDPEDRYRNPEEMALDLDRYRINNNNQLEKDDQDKTIPDSHVYSFDKPSTSHKQDQPSQNKPTAKNNPLETDDQTVAESGNSLVNNTPTQPDVPSSKKKRLLPLAAILSILLIIGGLWAAGIIPSNPPQPVESLDNIVTKEVQREPIATPTNGTADATTKSPMDISAQETVETKTTDPDIRSSTSHTITWVIGSETNTTSIPVGEIPTHKDPVKEADQQYTYTFSGWQPDVQAVTGDATYIASFTATPRLYTITWLDDTGKTIDISSVEYGINPTHTDPVKESDQQFSYSFSGWQPEIQKVTGDATYKATFQSVTRSYTITWLDDAGNTIDTSSVEYGINPIHADPVKESDQQYTYSFSGWQPEIQQVTGDAIYKPTFQPVTRSYTITWLDDTGNTIDISSVEYGSNPTHADPVKESDQQFSYSFSGWQPEIQKVTGDTTYKATFQSITKSYTITWVDDTGKTIDSSSVAYGVLPTHTDPTKEASQQFTYTFHSWSPKIQPVTENTTYTATYLRTIRSYTITWMNDAGEIIDTSMVAYGSKPTHVDPIKEPDQPYTYVFSGWKPTITKVSGDATYKASFIKTLKDGWICLNCQTSNSPDSRFCTNCEHALCLECGHNVARDNKFCTNCGIEVGKWKCSKCGEITTADDVFCTKCGKERHKPGLQ